MFDDMMINASYFETCIRNYMQCTCDYIRDNVHVVGVGCVFAVIISNININNTKTQHYPSY